VELPVVRVRNRCVCDRADDEEPCQAQHEEAPRAAGKSVSHSRSLSVLGTGTVAARRLVARMPLRPREAMLRPSFMALSLAAVPPKAYLFQTLNPS
jgi:hypothetical protein